MLESGCFTGSKPSRLLRYLKNGCKDNVDFYGHIHGLIEVIFWLEGMDLDYPVIQFKLRKQEAVKISF